MKTPLQVIAISLLIWMPLSCCFAQSPKTGTKSDARVQTFGLTVKSVTTELAKEFGVPEIPGVMVTAVEQGSPAQVEGMAPGDIIAEVETKPVRTPESFHEVLQNSDPKGGVMFHFYRKGNGDFKVLKEARLVTPVSDLINQGDAQFKAANFQGAMDLFKQAAAQSSEDVRIYYRISKTAQELKQRQAGLEAIQKIQSLKPELEKDKELLAMKQSFEAMAEASASAAHVQLDPQLQLVLTTVDELLKEAAASSDARTQQRFANQAREKLAPWLTQPPKDSAAYRNDPQWSKLWNEAPAIQKRYAEEEAVWRTAASVAIAQDDADLAAFSFCAIRMLRPDYEKDPALKRLILELNKLTVEGKVQAITTCWSSSVGNFKSSNFREQMEAAGHVLAGTGLPKWYRGGIKTIERLSEPPPAQGTARWNELYLVPYEWAEAIGKGEALKRAIKSEKDHKQGNEITRATATEVLAYIYAFGLFDVPKDEKRAKSLLNDYAKLVLPSSISYRQEQSEAERKGFFPPSADFDKSNKANDISSSYRNGELPYEVQALGVCYENRKPNADALIPDLHRVKREPMTIPKDDEAAMKWLEISLEHWADYKRSNPEVVFSPFILENVLNTTVSYSKQHKDDEAAALRVVEVEERVLAFCNPPCSDEHGKKYTSELKENLAIDYWNLSVPEWNAGNKSKALPWTKKAARLGYEGAQAKLRQMREKW